MFLVRNSFLAQGIFGSLHAEDGTELAKTLEHAYETDVQGEFIPKIPDGEFECVRGIHSLPHLLDFQTFEVTGIPGHTGILFHPGNFNDDSSGCILLGQSIDEKENMLLRSVDAFLSFMDHLKGVQSFILTVI